MAKKQPSPRLQLADFKGKVIACLANCELVLEASEQLLESVPVGDQQGLWAHHAHESVQSTILNLKHLLDDIRRADK